MFSLTLTFKYTNLGDSVIPDGLLYDNIKISTIYKGASKAAYL
jgi:hypothetical protein